MTAFPPPRTASSRYDNQPQKPCDLFPQGRPPSTPATERQQVGKHGVDVGAVVARRTGRPRLTFVRTAIALTALSLLPNLTFGFDAGSAATLITLHRSVESLACNVSVVSPEMFDPVGGGHLCSGRAPAGARRRTGPTCRIARAVPRQARVTHDRDGAQPHAWTLTIAPMIGISARTVTRSSAAWPDPILDA